MHVSRATVSQVNVTDSIHTEFLCSFVIFFVYFYFPSFYPLGFVLRLLRFYIIIRDGYVRLVKVKVKVKLFLCLTKHHAMKTYWGVEYTSTRSFTSEMYGDEWSATHPCRFTPRKRTPGIHWIGGWMGPAAGLDAVS
jgi:hypothetical protein